MLGDTQREADSAADGEVYVDDDNLPVEIKVDLAAAGAFEVHFSDYGKDVSIEAPPADQVSDLDLGAVTPAR